MVDSEAEEFRVGESKVQKLKKVLEEAIAQPDTSPRKVAALAGKILALSPAVLPAALYSREFYLALKGRLSWDEIFPQPQSVADTAKFWVENLDRYNGRKWWPKAVKLQATVDASAVGYGGLVRLGSEQPEPFTGTFAENERAQSSTAREVRGYAAALETAVNRFPERIRGAAILLEGDDQGAISALNHFRSPIPEINQVLRGIFRLCCENQFDVVAKWIPRESLVEADALSRLPDPSDWGLTASEQQKIFRHFGRRPTVDIFASDAHHVADKFLSLYYTPGCFAVDAIKQDWATILASSDLIWVFPPHRQVSVALSLLESARIEALVCMPVKSGSNEVIQLRQMAKASISAPYMVPRQADSCVASARVPSGTLNPAFLDLGVVHVIWL